MGRSRVHQYLNNGKRLFRDLSIITATGGVKMEVGVKYFGELKCLSIL